jgi:sugar lactone lactonase YvrE
MNINMKRMAGVAIAATTLASGAALAAGPAEIKIPGTKVFPESFTSSPDGSIYIGSVGQAQVYRVLPGKDTAEVFIKPGTGGLRQVFGVFAHGKSDTLWVCSNLIAGQLGTPATTPGQLMSFDIKTGAPKAKYDFAPGGMCNDIAVGGNGAVFATDTQNMQVMRLPPKGSKLEVWAGNGAFGPAGSVLDGIAVVDGRVIVNTLATSKLFAIKIENDGSAGKVVELNLSAPVTRPDGMRAHGKSDVLVTDGTGKIHRVTINGKEGKVTTLKEGLDGVVAVTAVGDMGYALEGQLGIMMARPGGPPPPAEKPYHAVGFPLK